MLPLKVYVPGVLWHVVVINNQAYEGCSICAKNNENSTEINV